MMLVARRGPLHITLHIEAGRDYSVEMEEMDDPLVAAAPKEVPLASAPLVRVIAQVRFPEVLSLEQRDHVAAFQETVRSAYPVLRQEQTQGVLIGPSGVSPVKPRTAWRFADAEGSWRVSLAPDFIALETTRYKSRLDFFSRFADIVRALDKHVEPKLVDRLGVRYIDRVSGAAVDEISGLVRAEVRGITGTRVASHASHALSESMFELDDSRVVARWGLLAPNTTVDPAAIEPIPERSWVLDLDMFSARPAPFAIDRVVDDAKRYAERIYTFFRWAVTDEFLRRYGGSP